MSSAKTKAALGKGVNLFDPAATISRFLTRRFGIVGGLAFVALLASTEGYEIVKALQEEFAPTPPVDATPVSLPGGVVYRDVKIGNGAAPAKGDFVGAHLLVTLRDSPSSPPDSPDGPVLLDTRANGRPVAFVYRARRGPGVVCPGLEMGIEGMKRGGVRVLDLPPGLGPYLGAPGAPLSPGGAPLAEGAALRYTVTLEEVSPAYM
jgi:hypothetical protein